MRRHGWRLKDVGQRTAKFRNYVFAIEHIVILDQLIRSVGTVNLDLTLGWIDNPDKSDTGLGVFADLSTNLEERVVGRHDFHR